MTGAPTLPDDAPIPTWAEDLRDRYLHTDTGLFVLAGNVHDVYLADERPWTMTGFLDAFFARSGKLVVHYDPGGGVRFNDVTLAARAAQILIAREWIEEKNVAPAGLGQTPEKTMGRNLVRELNNERNPTIVLGILEALLADSSLPVAVVIHYADLVAPQGDVSSQGFLDRTAGATLHRWSLWEQTFRNDNLVILTTSAVSSLSRLVTRNPRVGVLHVPLPGALERAMYLDHILPDIEPEDGERLTRITAGLQLRQIGDIVSAGQANGDDILLPESEIAARKKSILEQECFGLIEVIEPDHDFSVVGGLEPIKKSLMRIADHVKHGRRSQVPKGVLFVGPMGTGKSFVAEAFAKESGLAAIKLKNFRDKWVGSTEANLEKVLDVIEGLGEILVMIDEGDRSIGGAGDSDGGVNSRVIARLKEFMADPDIRGRVIFVMMTNRPDKLDTDMKRSGRFDVKIPFFLPQNATERSAIVRALIRRHKIAAELPEDELQRVLGGLEGYGAADLEALVLLAYDDLHGGLHPKGVDPEDPPPHLTPAYLAQAAHDFMPSRETEMLDYMELLAVFEASNRRLLPDRYREISLDDLGKRLREARLRLP
jgi:SpoVK/Ycf46/Vps4 family AAA+-type ATPase